MGQGPARNRVGLQRKKNLADYTIMLVGRTGAGKSSLGNFLTKRSAFKARACMAPITTSSKAEVKTLKKGELLRVIDTPGFGDMRPPEQVRKDLADAFYEARDGVDAFLFIINAGERVGADLIESFKAFEQFIHHEHFYAYVIPVFTRVDDRLALNGERDIFNRDKQRQIVEEDLANPSLVHLTDGILNKAKNEWICISSNCTEESYNELITNDIIRSINRIRVERNNLVCTNEIMEKAKEMTDEEWEKNKKADEAEIRKIVLIMLYFLFSDSDEEIEEAFGIKKKKKENDNEDEVRSKPSEQEQSGGASNRN